MLATTIEASEAIDIHRIPVLSGSCVEGLDVRTVGVPFDQRQGVVGRIPVKLLAWICALFAWKVVRQHDGHTYFENAVTGQRRCHWNGSAWGHIDYNFMRSGDVSYGPFGREVFN